jgi:hypothetical protein
VRIIAAGGHVQLDATLHPLRHRALERAGFFQVIIVNHAGQSMCWPENENAARFSRGVFKVTERG